jgi:hypothetical protein
MSDEPQNLLDLLQHLIDGTPDSRLRDRYREDRALLEAFVIAESDSGMSLGELHLWNIITNQYRTLAVFHQRIKALEQAVIAGRGHDNTQS